MNRIRIGIYSNNREKRLNKFEELIKYKTPIKIIKRKKGLEYCYFENENEVIQTIPLNQSSRGYKNHYVWLDSEFDMSSNEHFLATISLVPAMMMHESSKEYEENKHKHVLYF